LANRSIYADEFIRGWSDSTLLLFVFPEERLPISSVTEQWRRTSRFSAGEKEKEREEINLKREKKIFDTFSLGFQKSGLA